MSGLKSRLKAFFGFFLAHPVSVSNFLWLAVTGGFEQAVEEIAFNCPNKESKVKLYSVFFYLGPFLALWLMGILSSNRAWRLCQGLNSREKSGDCCKSCCGILTIAIFKALVLPLTWTVVALLDGDLFACFFYREECPPGTSPVNAEIMSCTINPEAWKKENKGLSQLFGWGCLVGFLLLALIVVFCKRYHSSRNYFFHLYANNLKQKERMLFEKKLQEQAEKDAEKNLEVLVMGYKESASKWEAICKDVMKKEYEKEKKKERKTAATSETITARGDTDTN